MERAFSLSSDIRADAVTAVAVAVAIVVAVAVVLHPSENRD